MRIKLFDIKLDSLSKDEFLHQISHLEQRKVPSLITTVNIEFINQALEDEAFFNLLNKSASINIIDGAGIIWL